MRTTSIPKIRKIHSGVWKLWLINSQNYQFWPENGQILATNGQILAISEFSWYIEYYFLKERHKTCFHTKVYENYSNFSGIKEVKRPKNVTRHSMIGSPERVKIQRSSIPKIKKIHSCIWNL